MTTSDLALSKVDPARLERKAIVGAALGSAFEWYDFFLYALLAVYFSAQFFPTGNGSSNLLLALATYGAGFVVRPLGALLFGSLGDRIGRKATFLITISIMGFATACVGILPTFDQVGWTAPTLLVSLRLLQGLSAGGEYGGAATYVAENAPVGHRGLKTSWLQTTATGGQLLALGVIVALQALMGQEQFAAWGWRLPFLSSLLLLGLSIYIRFGLEESPVFKALRQANELSKKPIRESVGNLANLKLIAIGTVICAGQGVIGYSGAVYPLYFLINVIRLDPASANKMLSIAILAALPVVVLAGKLSDSIGRKWLMAGTCLLAAMTFIPIFKSIVHFGNPALQQFQASTSVVVAADNCEFRVFVSPGTRLSPCDQVKNHLNKAGISYSSVGARSGAEVITSIGTTEISGVALSEISAALTAAGFKPNGDLTNANLAAVQLLMIVLTLYGAIIYGPLAAFLVELFPPSIRYTSVSIAYNFGTGWFGGMTPFLVSALALRSGGIYSGLWFPIVVTCTAFVIGALFLREGPQR